jgi:hypothetical protein
MYSLLRRGLPVGEIDLVEGASRDEAVLKECVLLVALLQIAAVRGKSTARLSSGRVSKLGKDQKERNERRIDFHSSRRSVL